MNPCENMTSLKDLVLRVNKRESSTKMFFFVLCVKLFLFFVCFFLSVSQLHTAASVKILLGTQNCISN